MTGHNKELFLLDKELPSVAYVEARPTVTILFRIEGGAVVLVRPHKVNHRANEWQFPQGLIRRHMLPRQAMLIVARAECGLLPYQLEVEQTKAIGVGQTLSRTGEVKTHYVVAVPVKDGGLAQLRRHVDVFLASDPNCVWDKVKDCRPPKREFIARVLRLAMIQRFLESDRWTFERLAPFAQFAGL